MKKTLLAKSFLLFAGLILTSYMAQATPIAKEFWGGPGAMVIIHDDFSAELYLGCGYGIVQAGRWPLQQSRIQAVGLFKESASTRYEKANYRAQIDVQKGRMSLIYKVGQKRPASYNLVKNQQPQMPQCD